MNKKHISKANEKTTWNKHAGTCLDAKKGSSEASVEVVACERNVHPELGAPQCHLLSQGSPQHGVDGIVTDLNDGVCKTMMICEDGDVTLTHQQPLLTCAHEDV